MRRWTKCGAVWVHECGSRVDRLDEPHGWLRAGWYFAHDPAAMCGPFPTAAAAKRACEADIAWLMETFDNDGTVGELLDRALLLKCHRPGALDA